MDELDQLLVELESVTQSLTSSAVAPTSPSPVSVNDNVASGFATALNNAIKTPPPPKPEETTGNAIGSELPEPKLPRSESLTFKVQVATKPFTETPGAAPSTVPSIPITKTEPAPQDRRPSHATLPANSGSINTATASHPQPPSPAWIKSPSSSTSLSQPSQSAAAPPVDSSSSSATRPRATSVNSTASTCLPKSLSNLSTALPSDSDRTCAKCQQTIHGPYVQALGQDWHLDHLACVACSKVLTATTFYEHQGALYCQQHHSELVAPRCAYCSGAITDRCVTALGQQWHPDHFFCSQCGKPLAGIGFMEHQGKAYCDEDYFALFAPPCGACGKPVMADCVAALQQSWHPSCFVCAECQGAFAGGTFFAHEGKPYCELHYHLKRGSLCPGCSRPIVGKCVNAMGKKWHPEHFACGYCQKNLNKMPFKEKEGKAFCVPCHTRLYG